MQVTNWQDPNTFFPRFINNLFGTIAGGLIPNTDVDFIPIDNKGNTIQVKGDSASWLGMRNPLMQKFAYDYCYPVASVFDRLAEYDLAGRLTINRVKGKGKEELTTPWANRVLAKLKRPNHLQTWGQFRGQQLIYKRTFGYCPMMPILKEGFGAEDAISIINLPPWLFDIDPTIVNRDFRNTDSPTYTLRLLDKIIQIKSEWVFMLHDSFMQNEDKYFLLPQSRLVGLDMAISNLCAAMEADNVLLKKKGPLGFISDDPGTKDSTVGYLPMDPDEKNELQNDLHRYGLSLAQYQYIISRRAAKWNPMSFNVTELGTKETIIAATKAICHRYGYPYVMYEMSESPFANSSSAGVFVYQNTVIPNADKDMEVYDDMFQSDKNNGDIAIDFSQLPVLQENKKDQADVLKINNETYEKAYKNNIITKNRWRELIGEERVEGDDIYYKDEVKPEIKVPDENTPPAN